MQESSAPAEGYNQITLRTISTARQTSMPTEARREVGTYFRFYNDQRPHPALGYRTPAEVFHQVTDVGEEGRSRPRSVQ